MYKDSVAVVEGILQSGTENTTLSYPSGFNSNNCVVESVMTSNKDNIWTAGSSFDTVSTARGGLVVAPTLTANNISLKYKSCVSLTTEAVIQYDYKCKVVLKKIY